MSRAARCLTEANAEAFAELNSWTQGVFNNFRFDWDENAERPVRSDWWIGRRSSISLENDGHGYGDGIWCARIEAIASPKDTEVGCRRHLAFSADGRTVQEAIGALRQKLDGAELPPVEQWERQETAQGR